MHQLRGALIKVLALPFFSLAAWIWLARDDPGFDIYAFLPGQILSYGLPETLGLAVSWLVIAVVAAIGLALWQLGSKVSRSNRSKSN